MVNWEFSTNRDFPAFEFFELDRKSNFTNIISVASFSNNRCTLVSEVLKDLLSELSLPDHIFYPVSVGKKNKEARIYYVFKIIPNGVEFIDYNASVFHIKNDETGLIESHDFHTDALKSIINWKTYPIKYPLVLRASKLVLLNNFEFDVFPVGKLGHGLIFSEKGKLYLEDNSIDVFDFSPLNGKNGRPLFVKAE